VVARRRSEDRAVLTIVVGTLLGFVVWLVMWARSRRRIHRAAAIVETARRVPMLVVGDLLVRPAAACDNDRIIESMDQAFLDANGWDGTPMLARSAHGLRQLMEPLGYLAVCQVDGADHDTMLGWASIGNVRGSGTICEVGFALHPDARARGLGPPAFAAVIEAIHRAGVRTIDIGTTESNVAMVACIRKAGAVEIRRGRKRLPNGSRPRAIWFEHVAEPPP
jgi:RimJ/RimL family protein N-acetyltransferase